LEEKDVVCGQEDNLEIREIKALLTDRETMILASLYSDVEKMLKNLKKALKEGNIDEAKNEAKRIIARKKMAKIAKEIASAMPKGVKGRTGRVVSAYLIYRRDGRLIISRKADIADAQGLGYVDPDVIAAVLRAVQEFISYCLSAGEEVNEISYGNYHILAEFGRYTVLVCIIEGKKDIRPAMRAALESIEKKLGNRLQQWDGDLSIATEIEPIISSFITQYR